MKTWNLTTHLADVPSYAWADAKFRFLPIASFVTRWEHASTEHFEGYVSHKLRWEHVGYRLLSRVRIPPIVCKCTGEAGEGVRPARAVESIGRKMDNLNLKKILFYTLQNYTLLSQVKENSINNCGLLLKFIFLLGMATVITHPWRQKPSRHHCVRAFSWWLLITHIMSCAHAVFLSSREDIWCYKLSMTVPLQSVYVL